LIAKPGRVVQKSLQLISSLRQLLVRISLTGAILEMSGKVSLCFQRTSLDAAIGEVPMATWMQTFLSLHANRLPPELRTTMLQMQLGWHAYEKQLQQQGQAAMAQITAESALPYSLHKFRGCRAPLC
jgi:hypothetical protein